MSNAPVRHPAGNGRRGHAGPSWDFEREPAVVFLEMTRACALACRHCRAEAQPKRDPRELTTDEYIALLGRLRAFDHPPIVILSGGDPFMRRDLFNVVEHGIGLGLTVSVSPSATALVTRARLSRLVEMGVSRVSFSLDGATAPTHDAFRGFPGTFDRTMRIMETAGSVGLAFQINTTVSRQTWPDLPAMATLLADSGAVLWDLFFLVPTGRGLAADLLSPEEHEAVFDWILDSSDDWPFQVKTTLGLHYRRAAVMRRLRPHAISGPDGMTREAVSQHWRGPTTNDGRGVLFVSHIGDIYPSGFLPIRAGNVRSDDVRDVYRNSPLFTSLRDSGALKGKCAHCLFNEVCGGSRARAYAVTGDPLAAEPSCAYQPGVAVGAEDAF